MEFLTFCIQKKKSDTTENLQIIKPGTGGGGGPGPWRRGAAPGDAAGGAAGPRGARATGAAGAGGGDRGTGGAGEVVRVPPPWINMVNGDNMVIIWWLMVVNGYNMVIIW